MVAPAHPAAEGALAYEQQRGEAARDQNEERDPELSYRYFVGWLIVRHMCADGL